MKRKRKVYLSHRLDQLKNFLTTINAESLQVNGRMFSWKKRIHMHLIYDKLDRVIGRIDWLRIYLDGFELHGCFTYLDHCPIILFAQLVQERRKTFPFCFQNFWVHYQRMHELIHKNWDINMPGTKMFQLVKKLKNIKYELKVWAKNQFGNFQDKVTKSE